MNVTSSIKKLYEKKKYLDSYGGSIAIASIIITVFGVATGYFYVLSNTQELKKEWEEIRCHPLYLPFAGIINKPPNKSISEFTGENFNICIGKILEKSTKNTISKYSNSNNDFAGGMGQFSKTIQSNRNLLNKFKNTTSQGLGEVTSSMDNFSTEATKPFLQMKNILNRTLGISTTSLYSILTVLYSFRPIASSIIGLIIIFFVISIGMIALGIITGALLVWIPFVGPFLSMPFFAIAFAAFAFLILSLAVGIPAIILCIKILSIMG